MSTEPSTEQMNVGEFLAYLGTDAQKWTDELWKVRNKLAAENRVLDHGTMLGWFANALEAGRAAGRAERVSS